MSPGAAGHDGALGRLALELGAAHIQHGLREVDAGDLVPSARQWKQHATGPAAELEDGPPTGRRGHRLPEAGVVPPGVDGVIDGRISSLW
jgi:hypothetical protein